MTKSVTPRTPDFPIGFAGFWRDGALQLGVHVMFNMVAMTEEPEFALPAELMGYRVVDRVGSGAGSVLYSARRPGSQQLLTLKHVRPKTEKDIRFVEQLETEFNVGQKVHHPGLRRSIDLKIDRSLFRKVREACLVLEYFEGESLEQRLPRPLIDIVDTFIRAGEALHALHAGGFVHCDLKPNNILRRHTDGDVKVIDFGQACPIGTAKQRIQGTPDYIAPEQVKCDSVSPATDVFNFGATMYWALTGANMPTLFTVMKKKENSFLLDQSMRTPIELNPTVPETLSNLVMECARTKSAKRPQSMRDVVLRLEIIQHVLRKQAVSPAHPVRAVATAV
jgi:serine/threonine-protein kinase